MKWDRIGRTVANVTNLKRLKAEDFEEDYQDLVNQLALILNPFLEQIAAAFNHGIDFDNLNQEVITFTTKLVSGVPVTKVAAKSTLKTRLRGMTVISAVNNTDNTFPIGAPFITYKLTSNGFEVLHITGIPDNKEFAFTVITKG